MGKSQSRYGLTEDLLDEYTSLTYLKKGEILYLMKHYYSINPDKKFFNYNHRFSKEEILEKFHVLKNNPFQDRLFKVFSSQNDDTMSFEDLIDLCSAMSPDCPLEVKAAWAFRVFDIDEDNQISERDIHEIIDRLTGAKQDDTTIVHGKTKKDIANVILEELELDNSRSIGLSEFKIMMSKLPDFESSFYFRL